MWIGLSITQSVWGALIKYLLLKFLPIESTLWFRLAFTSIDCRISFAMIYKQQGRFNNFNSWVELVTVTMDLKIIAVSRVEPFYTEKCPILRLVTPANPKRESCKQHTFWKLTKLNYSILTCGRLLMAAWCMRLRPDSSCFISWDICDLRDSSENTATKPLWAATFNPAGMFYKTQTWLTMWMSDNTICGHTA